MFGPWELLILALMIVVPILIVGSVIGLLVVIVRRNHDQENGRES